MRMALVGLAGLLGACASRVEQGGDARLLASGAGGSATTDGAPGSATSDGGPGSTTSDGAATTGGPESHPCGAAVVVTAADLEAIQPCTELSHLTVAHAELTTFSLPLLRSVGTLSVYGNPTLTTFDLPSLLTITQGVQIGHADVYPDCPKACAVVPEPIDGNPALTGFSMPALRSAKELRIDDNDALQSLAFPALERVTGSFTIAAHASLRDLTLPLLARVTGGQVAILNNTALTTLAVPSLALIDETSQGTSPAGLDVVGNDALAALAFPALTSVGQTTSIQRNGRLRSVDFPVLESVGMDGVWNESGASLDVAFNAALSTFSAPRLTTSGGLVFRENGATSDLSLPAYRASTCDVLITANPVLARLSLPELASLPADCGTGLEIDWNPMLPACQVQTVRDQLPADFTYVRVEGNLGTCP